MSYNRFMDASERANERADLRISKELKFILTRNAEKANMSFSKYVIKMIIGGLENENPKEQKRPRNQSS